ncbi:MAG: hypothetical protein D3923_09480 [Candidatus Electrothrix sp. AR3]|nr:hypothetical protein [Candidatus Electrothrix sp. AR3]
MDINQPIDFEVTLRLTGVAKGVDLGGELAVSKETITLHGCPLDIPDEIVTDITELERGGQGICCSDLIIPENVKMIDDLEEVCVAVIN